MISFYVLSFFFLSRKSRSILPFDRGSDHRAAQLIGLTWFSPGINVVVDCVTFVELTRECGAVVLQ